MGSTAGSSRSHLSAIGEMTIPLSRVDRTMKNEEGQNNYGDEMRPRNPLILVNVPDAYFSDNQLAAVIQSVEAALFSTCFRSYPQAFSTMYSGMEKLCKNISGLGKGKRFDQSWAEAGRRLNLLDHPIFRKTLDSKGEEIFVHQKEWSSLRNQIEHQGDSPSYDLQASTLLLGSLWDAFEILLENHKDYKLRSSLLPETRRAFDLTRRVLKLASREEAISKLFFDKPLVCHMRRLVQPTFQDWSFDNERYFNSNARFEDILNWRREIEGARSGLDWRGCDCPVCGSAHSIFAYRDRGDEKKLMVKFENFSCPECGFLCYDHNSEPHLSRETLCEIIEALLPEIQKDCGATEAFVQW